MTQHHYLKKVLGILVLTLFVFMGIQTASAADYYYEWKTSKTYEQGDKVFNTEYVISELAYV